MSETTSGLAEVVETALNNERQGYKILSDASEVCEDKVAKATFQFLANEELKHIDIIQRFAASGLAAAPDPGAPLARVDVARAVKGIFEQFGWQYEQAASEAEAREEAYKTAMEMERHGYNFYKKAAEDAKDPKARKFFEFLAAEEIRHYEIIQETLEFVQAPDAMLAMEERWMQV